MLPDDPRHGTSAGYAAHRDAGEPTCAECRAARVHYEKRRINDKAQGRPRLVDATGSKRRIQGLVALGWTYTEIGRRLGVTVHAVYRTLHRPAVQRSVADRIVEVYEQMSMTLPPTETRQQKRDASYARTVARKHGWLPPLAWTNIDDPAERPPTLRDKWDESSIDEAVIDRVLAGGKRPRKLTSAEAGEIVARCVARGMSTFEIERIYGLKVERYYRRGEVA